MFQTWREAAEGIGFASPRGQSGGFQSQRTQGGPAFQSPQKFAGGLSPADQSFAESEAKYVANWSDRVQGWGQEAILEQIARGSPSGWAPENPFDIPTSEDWAASAGRTTGESTGQQPRTGGGGTPATAGGAGWETQNQWDGSYTSTSKSTGTPANFIKAIQRIETGGQDYTGQMNCEVPGISDTMGCLALNTGLFQLSVEQLGLDFNRVVNDPEYAIYAMGVHMAHLAEQDAGAYGGAAGQSVLEYGGWQAVSQIYFTGSLAKDTDAGALGGRSFENEYWPAVEGYLAELGGMGEPVPAQAVDPSAATAAQPMPGSATGKITHVAEMWGGSDEVISQELGSMEGAIANNDPHIYDYCMDEFGFQGHCGLDVALPAGAELAAPVAGQVVQVGGQYFTDGTGGAGEIRIQAENGDIIILGHMASSNVRVGDYVDVGTLVGASGQSDARPESAHLHLEVRVLNPDGSYSIADPRTYFGPAVSTGPQ